MIIHLDQRNGLDLSVLSGLSKDRPLLPPSSSLSTGVWSQGVFWPLRAEAALHNRGLALESGTER